MNLEQFELLNITSLGSMISTSSEFLPISEDSPFVPALESISSSESNEILHKLQRQQQAENAAINGQNEDPIEDAPLAPSSPCEGTSEYILPNEDQELERKREKVRQVKRERAIRKEEQLKQASKKRLANHLQKILVSKINFSNVIPDQAPLLAPSVVEEVVYQRPKRCDTVSCLIPCQRKQYEDLMNKLQKQTDKIRQKQSSPIRKKDQLTRTNIQEQIVHSQFIEDCHPNFQRSICRGGFANQLVCMEQDCKNQAIHCMKPDCKECTQDHGLCSLKVNIQVFNSAFEKNLQRQSAILRQYQYTQKSIQEAMRRNKELVLKLAMFQGVDGELIKQLEQRYKSNGQAHLKGNEVIGFLKSISQEGRHRSDRQIKICESMIKSQHEILLSLDSHARMLIEPFQICDITILDSSLVRNKGEIKFILEELDFPLSLNLLYRASEHQFSISQFHEACDSQTDTFTIIKTEHGKLIGGFTPLKWGDKTYRDKQNKTFLLSITLKERLDHVNHGESAIHTDASLGPSFGGIFDKRDIEIFQKGGISFCSTSFPNTFNWKKFFTPSQESRRFLTGVEQGNICRVIDYEVYKVRPRIGQKI